MKKYLPISTGILIGMVLSLTMIAVNFSGTAYGEEESQTWNSFVARTESFSYELKDLFSPFDPNEKGKDLYFTVKNKLHLRAKKDAVKAIAGNYGLTTDEAEAVIGGSISPIFNNPDRSSANLTQEVAATLMANAKEEFDLLLEVYQLEQEIDVSVGPSEMFANGDLSDSGFDLVHDLDVIEEILFLDTTPSSIGAPYEGELDTPYEPTVDRAIKDDHILSETPVAVTGLALTDEKAVLTVGDKEIEAEILDEDFCPSENPLADDLKDFEGEEEDAGPSGDDGGVLRAGEEGDTSDDTGASVEAEALESAPASEWVRPWCPGLSGGDFTYANAGQETNWENLRTLGGTPGPWVSGGAAAGVNTPGFSANIALCLDVEFISEVLSSYYPGASCIQCEVEEILVLIDKTLSHSLIPNKATGNLMESAKCKQSTELLNIQIIKILNPIPVPPNDDVIFGRNILEEWNKFTERFQPVLWDKIGFEIEDRPELSDDYILQSQSTALPAGATQEDLYNDVNNIKEYYSAQAETDIKDFEGANQVADLMIYSQNILNEMGQMNEIFETFNRTFNDIIEKVFSEFDSKPSSA